MVGVIGHLKIIFYFIFSLYFKIAYSMHYFHNEFFYFVKDFIYYF